MTYPSGGSGEERRRAYLDQRHQDNVDRTNRLSSGLVRILLWVAVAAHLGFVGWLFVWMWNYFENPLPSILLVIVMSGIWIPWLRVVEFERMHPITPPTPIQRFRAPGPGGQN